MSFSVYHIIVVKIVNICHHVIVFDNKYLVMNEGESFSYHEGE